MNAKSTRRQPAVNRPSLATLLACISLLAACSTQGPKSGGAEQNASAAPPAAGSTTAAPAAPAPAPAPVAAAAPPAPPPILPFDDAVLSAAQALLGNAQLPSDAGSRFDVVIDPLIDGVTGVQSQATKAMGARIVKLIREGYPKYVVQPFNVATVERRPLLLVGTFTGVNAERKTEGKRESFRICLALADLKTGKLVSKGLAFARPDGVDISPLPIFRDSPAWMDDAATNGYVRTCQGTRAGDMINPQYVDRIVTSARIAEAADAYDAGKYAEAAKLYEAARKSPGGDQLRTFTGLYLANWRLGKRADFTKAFGEIVDQGLEVKKLGVKFLFKPSTAMLYNDPKAPPAVPYPMWLREISTRAGAKQSCLEVVGHSSATGPEPMNERLSQLRAEAIKTEITRASPNLNKRVIANGRGSKEMMIGNGKDDASDALDRRVEFKVVGC